MLLRVLQRERRGGDITLDIDSEKFFKGKNRCRAFLLHSIQAENSSESSSVLVFVWPQRGHTTLLVSSPAPPRRQNWIPNHHFFLLVRPSSGEGRIPVAAERQQPASIAARPPPLLPLFATCNGDFACPSNREARANGLSPCVTGGRNIWTTDLFGREGKKPSLRYEQGRLCSSLALSATFEEVTTTFRGSFVVQLSFFKNKAPKTQCPRGVSYFAPAAPTQQVLLNRRGGRDRFFRLRDEGGEGGRLG